MKVKIGNYRNWVGPYQIAEALCFWAKDIEGDYGQKSKPDWVFNFGNFLAHGTFKSSERWKNDEHQTWLYKLCTYIHSKKKRKIVVKLDKWDTWGMDSTLALIVLPMLKQLHATKHGAPFIEDEDVPDGLNLRSTESGPKENEYDTDDNHFKRWDWVLSEEIWAFEQLHDDCDWESQYHTGTHDWNMVPSKELDDNGKPKLYTMVKGPLDTSHFDSEGHQKHAARMSNAFRLFGKYFQAHWD